ncbi:protein PXR1-like [Osmia bicornis bicornis]|uniref:protein PXR1-like n=1 Tax=Osmia bicornis bicornis TaxID=1437191 RepID=UPI001EAF8473|nr:protein PXR1-like [Osmia bicornis bicornis]
MDSREAQTWEMKKLREEIKELREEIREWRLEERRERTENTRRGEKEEEKEKKEDEEKKCKGAEKEESRSMERVRSERRKKSLVWKGVQGESLEEMMSNINKILRKELGARAIMKAAIEREGDGGRKIVITELEEEEKKKEMVWMRNEIWEWWGWRWMRTFQEKKEGSDG